ncbi:nucleoside diphosphate kinase, partial [Coemansia reversa NRRL 1564]
MQRADDVRSTLVLIKPDVSGNEQAVARIIGRAVARGYTVKDRVDIALSRVQAAALYADHEGMPSFEDLVAAATSGPVIALLLEGDDVIRGWRMMIGPTDPTVARKQAPQSLRALLGTDTCRNAVHGSESPEAAQREIGFFF